MYSRKVVAVGRVGRRWFEIVTAVKHMYPKREDDRWEMKYNPPRPPAQP